MDTPLQQKETDSISSKSNKSFSDVLNEVNDLCNEVDYL